MFRRRSEVFLTPLGIFTVKSAEEDPHNLPADTLVSGAKAASGIMGSVGKETTGMDGSSWQR